MDLESVIPSEKYLIRIRQRGGMWTAAIWGLQEDVDL